MIEPVSRHEGEEDPDDALVDFLLQHDEQLRSGTTDCAVTCIHTPEETPYDAAGTLRFLTTLERLWPRSHPLPGSVTQSVLGRFRIDRVLGRGGFGVVYLATDTRLARKVALKVPRLHALAEPGLLDRFEREARAAAALDHPNIIPVYEAGEENGVCYIAAAYCPGPTLAEWLKEHVTTGVAPRLAAEILRQLADAVAYSHHCGIVHRDIKSGNVLLAPLTAAAAIRDGTARAVDDWKFTPRLADFGLAKIVDAAVADASYTLGHTPGSVVMGTPAYMAPEQLDGGSSEFAHLSDVYSLGVVLYELLTGRVPFPGTNTVDVIVRVRNEDPVGVRMLRPEVPRDLETICLKCLEKSPARRYAAAGDLRDDLRRFLDGIPILARPPSRLDTAHKWIRRHPARASALLIGGIAGIALVMGLWWHNRALDSQLATINSLRTQEQQQANEVTSLRYARSLPAASMALLISDAQPDVARELLAEFIPRDANAFDPRGPEWHYLWSRVTGPPLLQTFAHESKVPLFTAALWPDGSRVVTGETQGMIRIWDVATGRELKVLRAYDGEVKTLAVTPDGGTLVCGGQFYDVHLWDTTTWTQRTIHGAHDRSVQSMAISPSGTRLATGGRDGWIRLWDLASGTKLAEFHFDDAADGPRVVYSVHFAADESGIIALLPDAYANFNGQLQSPKFAADDKRSGFKTSAYAGPADRLFVGGYSCSPWITSVRAPVHITLPNTRVANQSGISADGRTLACGGYDGLIRCFREPAERFWQTATWHAHAANVSAVVVSADGTRLLTASADGTAKLWDLSHGIPDQFSVIAFKRNITRYAALSPDGRQFAVANPPSGGVFSVFDIKTGGHRRVGSRSEKEPIEHPRFSEDGQMVMGIVGRGGICRLSLLSKGASQRTPIPGATNFIIGAQPHVAYVVTHISDAEGWEIAEWDLDAIVRLRSIYQSSDEPGELAFRKRDGVLLICRGMAAPVLVCDTKTDEPPRVLASSRNAQFADISPTSDVAALAGPQGVSLVSITSGDVLAIIPSERVEFEHCVAFSPDGTRLAISRSRADDADSQVVIWDVKRRQPLLHLELPSSRISEPEWSRDGRKLMVDRVGTSWIHGSGPVVWTFGPDGALTDAAASEFTP